MYLLEKNDHSLTITSALCTICHTYRLLWLLWGLLHSPRCDIVTAPLTNNPDKMKYFTNILSHKFYKYSPYNRQFHSILSIPIHFILINFIITQILSGNPNPNPDPKPNPNPNPNPDPNPNLLNIFFSEVSQSTSYQHKLSFIFVEWVFLNFIVGLVSVIRSLIRSSLTLQFSLKLTTFILTWMGSFMPVHIQMTMICRNHYRCVRWSSVYFVILIEWCLKSFDRRRFCSWRLMELPQEQNCEWKYCIDLLMLL